MCFSFRMKSCEAILLFGISIDGHVLFKASLFILCFLALLLTSISILIVWLRKIQCRVDGLTKNTCSLPLVISRKRVANFERKNSWKNVLVSAAYGPLSTDRDGHSSDLKEETSFGGSLAQGNDSVHGSNTRQESIDSDKNEASNAENVDDSSAAHERMSNNSEQNIKGDKLKRDYMSLKGAKDHTYAKPSADSTQVESELRCDERQNGKALTEGKNDETHLDDNGYLVVIHSDKSSALSEGTETEMSPHEGESSYLIPIDSKAEENGHHKMETINGTENEGKNKAATFGHNAEFQQTQPGVSKHRDEDDYGYLIVQQVEANGAAGKAGTSNPVGQLQSGGVSQSDGPVNPGHGDENNYDYIQTKYWTKPVDNNDSKHQRNNAAGKGKPLTNSSADDDHEYLNVVHETEVNSSKEQENSPDQIYSIVHDSNNNSNSGVQSEVLYVNQNSVQNPGVEYSDDVPVYVNSEAEQQSFMCNDNTAFCDVDESPLYDNP